MQIEFLEKGNILKEYINNANNTVRLLITKKCNSKCAYCYEEGFLGSTNNMAQLLDLQDFKNIIKASKNLGAKRVSISGGEPTLFFDWTEELVKYCNDEGLLTYITTNATNPKIIDLAQKYPCLEFRISLDCSTREEYVHFRGIDAFDKVISTLQELCKLPNEIHINRVVASLTDEWMLFNRMIKMIKDKGLDKKNVFLRLIPAYPSKMSLELTVLEYLDYLAKYMPQIKAELSQRKLQFHYAFKYHGVNVILRTRGIYSPKCCPAHDKRCVEGIAYTRINPDGRIQPCFNVFLEEKINHKDSLKSIEQKLKFSREFLGDLYVKDYDHQKIQGYLGTL